MAEPPVYYVCWDWLFFDGHHGREGRRDSRSAPDGGAQSHRHSVREIDQPSDSGNVVTGRAVSLHATRGDFRRGYDQPDPGGLCQRAGIYGAVGEFGAGLFRPLSAWGNCVRLYHDHTGDPCLAAGVREVGADRAGKWGLEEIHLVEKSDHYVTGMDRGIVCFLSDAVGDADWI